MAVENPLGLSIWKRVTQIDLTGSTLLAMGITPLMYVASLDFVRKIFWLIRYSPIGLVLSGEVEFTLGRPQRSLSASLLALP